MTLKCSLCLGGVLLIAAVLIILLTQAVASSAAVATLTAFLIESLGIAAATAASLVDGLLTFSTVILASGSVFLANFICKRLGAC